jgi:hypothetical protein
MAMIKHIFLVAFTAVSAFSANAQICTPDTSLKVSGFLPAQLPEAEQDSFYNESISVLTFRDTFQQIGQLKLPVRVDSIKVTNIKGLPPGLTYKCQHPRCIYLWDTVRCVSIYGTPTQYGLFPIKIYVRAFAKLNGSASIQQNDSISRFVMVVNGPSASTKTVTNTITISPNPVQDYLQISVRTPTAGEWKITDMAGREMPFRFADASHNKLDVSQLRAGMYVLSNGQIKQHFIKQN